MLSGNYPNHFLGTSDFCIGEFNNINLVIAESFCEVLDFDVFIVVLVAEDRTDKCIQIRQTVRNGLRKVHNISLIHKLIFKTKLKQRFI